MFSDRVKGRYVIAEYRQMDAKALAFLARLPDSVLDNQQETVEALKAHGYHDAAATLAGLSADEFHDLAVNYGDDEAELH